MKNYGVNYYDIQHLAISIPTGSQEVELIFKIVPLKAISRHPDSIGRSLIDPTWQDNIILNALLFCIKMDEDILNIVLNQEDNVGELLPLSTLVKHSFSYADGVPRCIVLVTSVVPS